MQEMFLSWRKRGCTILPICISKQSSEAKITPTLQAECFILEDRCPRFLFKSQDGVWGPNGTISDLDSLSKGKFCNIQYSISDGKDLT